MKGKKAIVLFATLCLTCLICMLAACSPQAASPSQSEDESETALQFGERRGNKTGFDPEGRAIDSWTEIPESALSSEEMYAKNAEINAPSTHTDQFGFTVQPVPSDPKGWNISYLNADNRGCLSCHETIEDAVMSLDAGHHIYAMGYPTQLTVANCLGCHWQVARNEVPLSISLHGIHNGSQEFNDAGGSCDSCHFMNENGEFERWDYAKYDLYKGITDVAAEDAGLDIAYDQDTVTANEDIFFEDMNYAPSEWRLEEDPAVAESWVITFDGDVENPIEMTIPELVEKFGTTTVRMSQACVANGPGNAWIFQGDITGVPMQAIIDYVKPKDGVTGIKMNTEDGYGMPLHMDWAEDAVLCTEINGETLPANQGYPMTAFIPGQSAAALFKAFTGGNFVSNPSLKPMGAGILNDPAKKGSDNDVQAKPNVVVLSHPDGVVLEDQVGKELTIEGCADAYDEPIKKIEFSLDHGKTWTTLETPENDPVRWTYWRMTFTPQEAGSYLLKLRATSERPDGTDRVSCWDTNYLFNVR